MTNPLSGRERDLSRFPIGGEAFAAIDRAAGARFEGHERFLAAGGTNGRISAATPPPSAAGVVRHPAIVPERLGPGTVRFCMLNQIGIAGGAPGCPAIETAHRSPKTALLVEALLLLRKSKGLLAVDTDELKRFGRWGQNESTPKTARRPGSACSFHDSALRHRSAGIISFGTARVPCGARPSSRR